MDRETLLIVEDNLIMREGLRDILTLEGYRIETAENGREALEVMNTTTPELIVSDIAMPEMDGYAFFQAVRSRSEWVTIPFIFLTARGEREDILAGKDLGAEDYLVKPLTRNELLTAVRARLDRSQELQLVQMQKSYDSSLTVLANAIDVRDPYTYGHVERVTAYSHEIGTQFEWQGRMLDQLRYGAILHDIGKIFIDEATLLKSGPLTDEEWDEMKRHPITGSNMVRDIPYLAVAIPVVRHHHERWDGRGYPDGISGSTIPLAARIVSVADGFDAMTTTRPYQKHRTLEQAYEEVMACSGTQYDPEVVSAFQRAWESGKIQAIRQRWDVSHDDLL